MAQLLTLMDGAGESDEVVVPVVATTSRPNAIDPALRRPGRFDREVELSLPNAMERAEILKLHAKSIPLADDVALDIVAFDSKGYSGADIAALCRLSEAQVLLLAASFLLILVLFLEDS